MENLIAHRGLKNHAQENTLDAFQKSLNNEHYAGFECDVRTTKDNVFVICHNPIYKGKIISLTPFKELDDGKLATLESVLSLKTSKIILLEIKEINCNIKHFSQILEKYSHQKIYVMSFYNFLIHELKHEIKNASIGVLNYVLNSEEDYKDYDFICLLESIVTPKIINYFTGLHKEIFIYNIHHLEVISKKYKKSYFITDVVVE